MEKAERFYKYKSGFRKLYCALCRKPRVMYYSKNLSAKNYLQVGIMSLVLCLAFLPLFSYRIVIIPLFVWFIFDVVHRLLYRNDVVCPFCGFDPYWYKKDVTKARDLVTSFFKPEDQAVANLADESKDESPAEVAPQPQPEDQIDQASAEKKPEVEN